MSEFSKKFLEINEFQTKNISIVLEIDGYPLISNRPVYTYLRYGDFIYYGEEYVYGGLRRVEGTLDYLSLDRSSLTISQKIEPEQGRGSISTLSFGVIDKNQEITRKIAELDPLGRTVQVWLGYQEVSFKEDYVRIFRGRVSNVTYQSGIYVFTFSDFNLQKREKIFLVEKTKLKNAITATDTNIELYSTAFMYQGVTDPLGKYDCRYPFDANGNNNPGLAKQNGYIFYMKIEDEWIAYPPTPINSTIVQNCLRGQRGTVAVPHAADTDVEFAIEFQDHVIDIALKLMLSGRADYFVKDLEIQSIVSTGDPVLSDQYNAIVLKSGQDAVRDYGLVAGDWVRITGAANAANNVIGRIVKFEDLNNEQNRLIYIDQPLVPEVNTTAKVAFRSKYDVYPKETGVRLTSQDVEVADFEKIKQDFLSGSENTFRFFITKEETAKTFLENEIYLPTASYSLTRWGKLSIGYSKTPIYSSKAVVLDKNNLIDATNITVIRGLTNRRYFTEVDYSYDYDDQEQPRSFDRFINLEHFGKFGVNQILPIASRGMRTMLGAKTMAQKRSTYIISRYSNAAVNLQNVKVNFNAASRIEVGDVVLLKDEDGTLGLIDFSTDSRKIGVQLFEVINKSFDLKSGVATLELLNGFGTAVNDRFGVISPNSEIESFETDLLDRKFLYLKKSFFGLEYGEDEGLKWNEVLNLPVTIRNLNYSFQFETKIKSIDPVNKKKIEVEDYPTSLTLPAWLDLSPYPGEFADSGLISLEDSSGSLLLEDSSGHLLWEIKAQANKNESLIAKNLYVFLAREVSLIGIGSNQSFQVSTQDLNAFKIGGKVIIHDILNTERSGEIKVTNIAGNTVTLEKPLSFTITSNHYALITYMPDGLGVYRYYQGG